MLCHYWEEDWEAKRFSPGKRPHWPLGGGAVMPAFLPGTVSLFPRYQTCFSFLRVSPSVRFLGDPVAVTNRQALLLLLQSGHL